MGYTHYWHTDSRKLDLTEYREAIVEVAQIVRASPVPLGDAHGEGEPELSDERLAFNGRAGELAHETFALPFQPEQTPWEKEETDWYHFDFCKTARKPYDVVVTAALIVMQARISEGFHVSSDGEAEDWAAGLDLARESLGEAFTLPPHVAAYDPDGSCWCNSYPLS